MRATAGCASGWLRTLFGSFWKVAGRKVCSNMHFTFPRRLTTNLELFRLLLFIRWIEVKHFPLSNLYESLIFLSLSFTFAQILIDRTTNNTFAGVVVSPIVLLTTTFGSFTLPAELQKGTSLVPALQSNWLMMHVTIMMLSYAALIVGSLFAFVFLILTQLKANHLFDVPGNFSIKHPFNGTLNGIESTLASNHNRYQPLHQHQAENEGIVSCAEQ
jgi:hypothetical protein